MKIILILALFISNGIHAQSRIRKELAGLATIKSIYDGKISLPDFLQSNEIKIEMLTDYKVIQYSVIVFKEGVLIENIVHSNQITTPVQNLVSKLDVSKDIYFQKIKAANTVNDTITLNAIHLIIAKKPEITNNRKIYNCGINFPCGAYDLIKKDTLLKFNLLPHHCPNIQIKSYTLSYIKQFQSDTTCKSCKGWTKYQVIGDQLTENVKNIVRENMLPGDIIYFENIIGIDSMGEYYLLPVCGLRRSK